MRRSLVAFAAVMLAAAGSPAADVKTMDINLKSGDETIKGYLAVPDGKGPFAGIVVIQEWWGLNDWIKENTRRLAAQGYVALAPDLYRGKVTDDASVASQLLKGLPRDRALRDLKSAVDFLVARPDVKKDRIGSIGWCMGGNYSLQLAQNDPRVTACVICYGRVVEDSAALKPLQAAVLGIFGADDRGIPAASVRGFEAALKQAGKPVERIEIYKGAGHGFMRPTNGPNPNPEYREAAAKDAWQRIEQFFAKELGK